MKKWIVRGLVGTALLFSGALVATAAPLWLPVGTDLACSGTPNPSPIVYDTGSFWGFTCGLWPSSSFTLGIRNPRTLTPGTAVQCTDPTKSCYMGLTIASTISFSIVGSAANTADFVAGTTSAIGTSGGTAIGQYSNSISTGLSVGVATSTGQTQTVVFPIGVGEWFAIRTVSGTYTVSRAYDQSAS